MREVFITRLIGLLALLVSIPVYAESVYFDFELGGLCYIIYGDNVSVAQRAFDNGYEGDIVIPDQVGYNGYTYKVTGIDNNAFEWCPNLKSVVIPGSVTYIGYGAFFECRSLKSITIPNSVTSIGDRAFRECENLTTIISEIKEPFMIASGVFVAIPSDAELIVPQGTKAAYQATEGWNNFAKITEATSGRVDPTNTSADYANQYFTFVARESGTFRYSSFSGLNTSIQYSLDDGQTWTTLEENTDSPKMSVGNKIIWKANSTLIAFSSTGQFEVQGNIMSLLYDDNFQGQTSLTGRGTFMGLFGSCIGLLSAENLVLPATSLTSDCYKEMFRGCTSLIKAPKVLPATTLAWHCYSEMFQNCSNLMSAPELPATILEEECYFCMFEGCSQLNEIICLATDLTAENCTRHWLRNVSPTGIFHKKTSMASWTRGDDGIPEGWTVQDYNYSLSDNDQAFKVDGIFYEIGKNNTVSVISGDVKYSGVVLIPGQVTYKGMTYQVTGVADDAFKGSNMGALIWDVEAALPSNAFSNASIGSNFLLYVKSASYAPSTVKNVVVDGTAQTIVLSDDGGQFYCPQAFTARRISYSHNYSMETGKGSTMGWETIALPFDVQRIIHSIQGEVVPFAAYSSGSNQKPFWLAYMSAGGFKRTADIRANEAYIIAMPNNSSYQDNYILAGDVTFSAENITVPKTPTFNGTFLPAFSIVAKSSSVYALNVNNRYIRYSGSEKPGSIFIRDLRDVRPFEAYLTGNFTRGIIEINFDNGTTDILDVLLSTDDS